MCREVKIYIYNLNKYIYSYKLYRCFCSCGMMYSQINISQNDQAHIYMCGLSYPQSGVRDAK